MKRSRLIKIAVLAILLAAIGAAALSRFYMAGAQGVPGRAPTSSEMSAVKDAADLMQGKGLMDECAQARRLLAAGQIRSALDNDKYLAAEEKAGNTPFAYTLPRDDDPHHPIAIVLAPSFYKQATPAARASVLIHEMAHWNAYVKTGKSDEYDGYKAQFDTYKKLGLSNSDGLIYFMLLDGVTEYVVPRDKKYENDPEVKEYRNSGSGSREG